MLHITETKYVPQDEQDVSCKQSKKSRLQQLKKDQVDPKPSMDHREIDQVPIRQRFHLLRATRKEQVDCKWCFIHFQLVNAYCLAKVTFILWIPPTIWTTCLSTVTRQVGIISNLGIFKHFSSIQCRLCTHWSRHPQGSLCCQTCFQYSLSCDA